MKMLPRHHHICRYIQNAIETRSVKDRGVVLSYLSLHPERYRNKIREGSRSSACLSSCETIVVYWSLRQYRMWSFITNHVCLSYIGRGLYQHDETKSRSRYSMMIRLTSSDLTLKWIDYERWHCRFIFLRHTFAFCLIMSNQCVTYALWDWTNRWEVERMRCV